MKTNSTKSLSKMYFISALFVLISSALYGGYYFWEKGTTNPDMLASIHENSIALERIVESKEIDGVRKLVKKDNARAAINRLDTINKQIRKVSASMDFDLSEDFQNSSNELNIGLKKVISLPKAKKIHGVFANKLSSFRDFVVYNRWATLTRLSNRAVAIYKNNNSQYTSRGILRNVKKVTRLINTMEKVTTGSILTADKKNSILNRLEGLRSEVKMLQSYGETVSKVAPLITNYEKQFNSWHESLGPNLIARKLSHENSFKELSFFFIGYVALMFALLGFGLVVFSRENAKTTAHFESDVSEILKKAIVGNEIGINMDQFSQEFQKEILKNREFLQKRISFGSVFQDALPFAAILLDSNLNLIWGNSHFYEQWDMVGFSKREENISWDYLQRFTNLGEDDPIFQALNKNLAGIYQIQIKANSVEMDSIPYEMYVSPVEYRGEKRIMVFFYPLRSLQETLSYQTKSIVGPVSRSLEALTTGTYNEDFQERISNDFDVAGISQVYEKFNEHHEFIAEQRGALLAEIERTENEAFDLYKTINDICRYSTEARNMELQAIKSFKIVKDKIIDAVNIRSELEETQSSTAQNSRKFIKTVERLNKDAQEVKGRLQEITKSFEGLSHLKTNFKDMKVRVEDFRSRIVQSLDQALLMGKSNNVSPEKVNQSLNKIKLEVRTFDRVLSDFSKEVTGLDVALSKAELLINSKDDPELEDLRKDIEILIQRMDDDSFNMGKLANRSEDLDNKVVEGLKSMFESFNTSRKKIELIKDLGGKSIAEYHDRPKEDVEVENMVAASSEVPSPDQVAPTV